MIFVLTSLAITANALTPSSEQRIASMQLNRSTDSMTGDDYLVALVFARINDTKTAQLTNHWGDEANRLQVKGEEDFPRYYHMFNRFSDELGGYIDEMVADISDREGIDRVVYNMFSNRTENPESFGYWVMIDEARAASNESYARLAEKARQRAHLNEEEAARQKEKETRKALGLPNRGNLTEQSQEEISNLDAILRDHYFGYGNFNASEYLSDDEMLEVLASSDILIQSYSDLINQSNLLFDQGKYNESLQTYDEFVKLDSIIGDVWSCRCAAMWALWGKGNPSPTANPTQTDEMELYMKCQDCDYNAGQFKNDLATPLTTLKRNVNEVRAQFAKEEQNRAHQAAYKARMDAFNASGIEITPDSYESSQVLVPLGPYDVRFSIRTIEDVAEMETSNKTTSLAEGSGKSYHINNFTLYIFEMPKFDITIAQYTGPAGIVPENPFELDSRYSAPDQITIDGRPGQLQKDFSGDSALYSLNKNTFVSMYSKLNYDKDFALILETIHIAERK